MTVFSMSKGKERGGSMMTRLSNFRGKGGSSKALGTVAILRKRKGNCGAHGREAGSTLLPSDGKGPAP